MSASRVIRHDGTEHPLEQMAAQVSASLFQTDLHYELCARVARAQCADQALLPVLHNVLTLKAPLLRGATALRDAVRREPASFRRVLLPPALVPALGDELRARGIEVQPLPQDPPLVRRGAAAAFGLKALLHRLYRLARRPLQRGTPLVRGWVDVTDALYGDVYPRAQVRVYPFALGWARQLAYVRSLRARGLRWSLDGVPYRWADVLAPLWPARTRHLRLAAAERGAYDLFARELLAAGVREVYTSDEYEVGAVAAGERLRAGGAAYVNTAHGSGLFCPQVGYTRFHYLNDYQAAFYRRCGRDMELRKRSKPNSHLPFERAELQARSGYAVVYVHQNFEDYNLPSETAAQRAIVQRLGELARELGVEALVKLHPNMPAQRFASALPENVRLVSRWHEIRQGRPVFLTIYSSAYFELAQVAPVLVYAGPTYDASVYLDGDFQTFTLDDLAGTVARLRDPDAWRGLVERQRASLGAVAA